MAAGLRATAKAVESPPAPTIGAPVLDPTMTCVKHYHRPAPAPKTAVVPPAFLDTAQLKTAQCYTLRRCKRSGSWPVNPASHYPGGQVVLAGGYRCKSCTRTTSCIKPCDTPISHSSSTPDSTVTIEIASRIPVNEGRFAHKLAIEAYVVLRLAPKRSGNLRLSVPI